MSTLAAPQRRSLRNLSGDVKMAFSQLRYEQLSFWRNPVAAVFTVGFSVIFLVMLGAAAGNSKSSVLPGIRLVQYYVPVFTAYGVMSTAFSNLALTIVVRRESGQLKRLRLSPLSVGSLLGGLFLNMLAVCVLQVILLLGIGRFGYHVQLPSQWLPLVLALLVGAICFAALGIGVSSLVPNQEAGGPLVNIAFFVLLFVSGMWFPILPSSGLAKIATYFPIIHFFNAVVAPFYSAQGGSPWRWHDLGVLALWGIAGVVISLRRFRFEPRRH